MICKLGIPRVATYIKPYYFKIVNLHKEVIVVDEIGFVPLHKDTAELLLQVISDRYERKSLIITSKLEFSQWTPCSGTIGRSPSWWTG